MRALSMARTWKVCEPMAKLVYFLGEVQLPKAAPSREHSKVEPASEEEKPNVAELLLVIAGGPESMVVSGGVVSCGRAAAVLKDHVLSAASGLPARSFTPFVPPLSVAV